MKVLLATWNNIFDDIIPELHKRGHKLVATVEEADYLLLWNETWLSGRPLVEKAHKLGKKAITLQHGRFGSSRVYPPFNEEIISDKYLCWGEGDKQRLLTIGTNPDILEVVGSPVLTKLKSRIPHKGFNVVFCPEHWDKTEAVENLAVATELKKLKNVTVYSKLLEDEHDPRFYQNPVVSKRNAPGHIQKSVELLTKADVVVALLDGTFELMAEAMDIPVILIDIWQPKVIAGDKRYLEYRRPSSDGCTRIKDIKELNKTVMYHLKHPEALREERRLASISDGGTNIKDPIGNILKIIDGLVL